MSAIEQPIYVFRTKGRFITSKDSDGKRSVKVFEANIAVPKANITIFDDVTERVCGQDENGKAIIKRTEFTNYLGILRRKLIPAKLKATNPDFQAVRDMRVIEVVGVNGAEVDDLTLPISMLSVEQLKRFCNFHSISKEDIDPAKYLDIDELREDVFNFREDPESFRRQAENKRGRRANEAAFKEFNDIDADVLLAKGKTGVMVNESPKQTVRPKLTPKADSGDIL